MGKKTQKLYELIHSLSMSEKRYLTLYTSRHTIGEKNLSQTLFETIDKEAPQDDKALKELLKARGVAIKNLSSDKNYLYRLLLRGLGEFHSDSTSSLQVKELIQQTEILFRKGLFNQGLWLAQKANKLATEEGLFPDKIAAALWEVQFRSHLGMDEGMAEVLDASAESLAFLDNLHAYVQLFYQMLELFQAYVADPASRILKKAEELMQHPFLAEEQIALTYRAKIYYWETHLLFYRLTGACKETQTAIEQLFALMEEEAYLENHTKEYFSVLTLATLFAIREGEGEFSRMHTRLMDLPKRVRKERKYYQAKVATYVSVMAWVNYQYHSFHSEASKAYSRPFPKHLSLQAKILSPDEKIQLEYFYGFTLMLEGAFSEACTFFERTLSASTPEQAPLYVFSAYGVYMVALILNQQLNKAKRIARTVKQLLKGHTRTYPEISSLVEAVIDLVYVAEVVPESRLLEAWKREEGARKPMPVLEEDFPLFRASTLREIIQHNMEE